MIARVARGVARLACFLAVAYLLWFLLFHSGDVAVMIVGSVAAAVFVLGELHELLDRRRARRAWRPRQPMVPSFRYRDNWKP